MLTAATKQKEIDNLTDYVRKGGPALLLLDPLPYENPQIAPEVPRMPPGGPFGGGPPPEPKGDLRLDKLAPDFADEASRLHWLDVLNRVKAGEMPPKAKPRPPEKESHAVLTALQRGLHESSLDKQRREGRVVLRRMNRTEYQTTLRDLLGIPVEVKDLLPDDNVSAGFDDGIINAVRIHHK